MKGRATVSAGLRFKNGCATAAVLAILAGGCQSPANGPAGVDRDAYQARLDEARRRANALFEEGQRARAADRQERARELFKEAIDVDGTHGRARHALGLVYAEAGDLYNAAIHLDAASRLFTDAPEPCYNLGVVLERGGRYELAIAAYERALGRRPDHLHTLENLARVRLKAGYRDETTLRLLKQCRPRESRGEWVDWLDRQAIRLSIRDAGRAEEPAVSDGSGPAGEGVVVSAGDGPICGNTERPLADPAAKPACVQSASGSQGRSE